MGSGGDWVRGGPCQASTQREPPALERPCHSFAPLPAWEGEQDAKVLHQLTLRMWLDRQLGTGRRSPTKGRIPSFDAGRGGRGSAVQELKTAAPLPALVVCGERYSVRPYRLNPSSYSADRTHSASRFLHAQSTLNPGHISWGTKPDAVPSSSHLPSRQHSASPLQFTASRYTTAVATRRRSAIVGSHSPTSPRLRNPGPPPQAEIVTTQHGLRLKLL